MEIVTAAELAEYFERLTGTIEDLGMRLNTLSGTAPQQEYFTRDEAADYLRISLRQLDSLSYEGKIKRAKFGDAGRSSVVFRKRDLDEYVESRLLT